MEKYSGSHQKERNNVLQDPSQTCEERDLEFGRENGSSGQKKKENDPLP